MDVLQSILTEREPVWGRHLQALAARRLLDVVTAGGVALMDLPHEKAMRTIDAVRLVDAVLTVDAVLIVQQPLMLPHLLLSVAPTVLELFLKHCPDVTMVMLLPVLCERLPSWGLNLQTKAAQGLFGFFSADRLELSSVLVKQVTAAVFEVIDSKVGVEASDLYKWCGSILVEVLPRLPAEAEEAMRLVDVHAKQPLPVSRTLAARVLGALVACVDDARLEQDILPRVEALLEDPDTHVRMAAIENLGVIGGALPIRVAEDRVWGKLTQAWVPEEGTTVRAAALRAVAYILQKQREHAASGRLFCDLLPPLFAEVSALVRRHAPEDQRLVNVDTYELLEVVSEVFGQLLYSMTVFQTDWKFLKSAYKTYCLMGSCNGRLIRRWCAFNLPGVTKALGNRFACKISRVCVFLAKDSDDEVRQLLAGGIHQSAALLCSSGCGSPTLLCTAVCDLLEDERQVVRMRALENLPELLPVLVQDLSDMESLWRIALLFASLTVLSEGHWRIQKCLAEQLGKCTEAIPPEALVENVLPLLYQLAEKGNALVRQTAMSAIACTLRSIPMEQERCQCVSRFWAEAMSGPFRMRLALLDGGAAALKIFSGPRFASMFAPTLLELATDPVANVRIRIASMLPEMAPACLQMPVYADAVDKLRYDEDKDVVGAMDNHDKGVEVALGRARSLVAIDSDRFHEEDVLWGLCTPPVHIRDKP